MYDDLHALCGDNRNSCTFISVRPGVLWREEHIYGGILLVTGGTGELIYNLCGNADDVIHESSPFPHAPSSSVQYLWLPVASCPCRCLPTYMALAFSSTSRVGYSSSLLPPFS